MRRLTHLGMDERRRAIQFWGFAVHTARVRNLHSEAADRARASMFSAENGFLVRESLASQTFWTSEPGEFDSGSPAGRRGPPSPVRPPR